MDGPSKERTGHEARNYSNEQIVYALKRVEAGEKASQVCWVLGVSAASFYQWKKTFGGIGVSDLKKLVADLSLDRHILQEVLAKKV